MWKWRRNISLLPLELLNGREARHVCWQITMCWWELEGQSLTGSGFHLSSCNTCPSSYGLSVSFLKYRYDVVAFLPEKLLWLLIVKRASSSPDRQSPVSGSDFPNVSDCYSCSNQWETFIFLSIVMPRRNHNLLFWPLKVWTRRNLPRQAFFSNFSWNKLFFFSPFPKHVIHVAYITYSIHCITIILHIWVFSILYCDSLRAGIMS